MCLGKTGSTEGLGDNPIRGLGLMGRHVDDTRGQSGSFQVQRARETCAAPTVLDQNEPRAILQESRHPRALQQHPEVFFSRPFGQADDHALADTGGELFLQLGRQRMVF